MKPITPDVLKIRKSELESILTEVLNDLLMQAAPTLTSRMVSFQEQFVIDRCRERGMNAQEYMFVRNNVLEAFNEAGWIASYVPPIHGFGALLNFIIRAE